MDREIYEKVVSGNIEDIRALTRKGAGIEVTWCAFPFFFFWVPSKILHGVSQKSERSVYIIYILEDEGNKSKT